MDKISKLLQETQSLLENFSSDTLSPISSSDNEMETEPEPEEFDYASLNKFRKFLKRKSEEEILKIIEKGKFPRKALHICVEERCKNLEIYKALLREGCDALETNDEGKTALDLLLDQKEFDKEEELLAEDDKCLISTLLGEWELRRAATNESKLFKLIHSKNWKNIYNFLLNSHDDTVKIICKPDAKYAGISPLHEIAATNDVFTLKKLLAKFKGSIDLNTKAIGSGNTPLHEATHMSAIEMVGLLLELGARSDIKNAAGKIPAHLGTEKIQVLIEIKSKRDSNLGPNDAIPLQSKSNSKSQSDISRDLNSKKTADLFVKATKSVSASSESLSREERKLKQIIGFLDQIDKHKEADGNPIDSESEESLNVDKRTKLMDLETILQRDNHTGRTILHRFARRNQSEKLMKFLKIQEFTSNQCKELKLFEVIDNSGYTPLHDAASEGSLEVAKIFLFGGRTAKIKNLLIDPSIPAKLTGDTALHAASAAGNVEIVQLLLDVGAKCDAVNIEGKKPIDITISKVIKKLLKAHGEDEEEEEVVKEEEGEENEYVNEEEVIPEKIVGQPIKTSPSSTKSIQPVTGKRGPGRPRKHPRPNEIIPANKDEKPKELIRSPSKHQLSNFGKLPINEIISDNSNCIILIKFDHEWLMLKDHFLSLYHHLQSKLTHHISSLNLNLNLNEKCFRPAKHLEKIQISKLPQLGDLIEILKIHSSSPDFSLIPKSSAFEILDKDLNFPLTGPFGYIDIGKILGNNGNYGGCPLKLKMKKMRGFDDESEGYTNNNSNSNSNISKHCNLSIGSNSPSSSSSLHILASASVLEPPKSPKSFHI